MSQQFLESFGAVDGNHALEGRWDLFNIGGSPNVAYGRNGTKGIALSSGQARKFCAAHATYIVGAGYKGNNTALAGFMLLYGDTGATLHLTLAVTIAGAIHVYRGYVDGTLLAYTADGVVPASSYITIGFKATCSDSVGAIAVQVDGVDQALTYVTGTAGNQDTKNGGTNTSFDMVAFQSTISAYMTDVTIFTGDGTAPNDLIGDYRIECLIPTADTAQSDFTPSTGTDNYAMVDEVTTVNDADYVSGSTVTDKDRYVLQDLTSTTGVIKGLQVTTRAFKSDTGIAKFRSITELSTVEADNGTDEVLSQGPVGVNFQHPFPLDPNGSAWTIANVNAMTVGHVFAANS